MLKVVPGILEKDWQEIERKIELCLSFSDTVHIDVIDGKFVSNITFLDPTPFAKYKDKVFLEVHLMVDEPINYLKPFAQAGFKGFIGQIEKMSNQEEFIAEGQLLGKVGLSLDGPTQESQIKANLEDLDYLLVYTAEKVGFSNASFLPERLEKIKRIRQKSKIPIIVDGGINDQTIFLAKESGANIFSSTGFIFNSEDPIRQFHIFERKNKLK